MAQGFEPAASPAEPEVSNWDIQPPTEEPPALAWSDTPTAPAGKTWHLTIHSLDKLPYFHNFIITTGPTVAERIFLTSKLAEGTTTLDLPALPAGTYTFLCSIHPDTMTGTLTVKG